MFSHSLYSLTNSSLHNYISVFIHNITANLYHCTNVWIVHWHYKKLISLWFIYINCWWLWPYLFNYLFFKVYSVKRNVLRVYTQFLSFNIATRIQTRRAQVADCESLRRSRPTLALPCLSFCSFCARAEVPQKLDELLGDRTKNADRTNDSIL